MNYLHTVLSGETKPLPLNQHLKQLLMRQESVQDWLNDYRQEEQEMFRQQQQASRRSRNSEYYSDGEDGATLDDEDVEQDQQETYLQLPPLQEHLTTLDEDLIMLKHQESQQKLLFKH